MPKKSAVRKSSPSLWSPRLVMHGPMRPLASGRMPRRKRPCAKGFHTAKGYTSHSPKKWCVKDCHDWKPPRVKGSKGRCVRPQTPWMRGLLAFYQAQKAIKPNYKYSEAMKAYAPIYRQEGWQ